jgi:hypothetical protein
LPGHSAGGDACLEAEEKNREPLATNRDESEGGRPDIEFLTEQKQKTALRSKVVGLSIEPIASGKAS